jgi:hypothetical protein
MFLLWQVEVSFLHSINLNAFDDFVCISRLELVDVLSHNFYGKQVDIDVICKILLFELGEMIADHHLNCLFDDLGVCQLSFLDV